jgi:hypothetical protein
LHRCVGSDSSTFFCVLQLSTCNLSTHICTGLQRVACGDSSSGVWAWWQLSAEGAAPYYFAVVLQCRCLGLAIDNHSI